MGNIIELKNNEEKYKIGAYLKFQCIQENLLISIENMEEWLDVNAKYFNSKQEKNAIGSIAVLKRRCVRSVEVVKNILIGKKNILEENMQIGACIEIETLVECMDKHFDYFKDWITYNSKYLRNQRVRNYDR